MFSGKTVVIALRKRLFPVELIGNSNIDTIATQLLSYSDNSTHRIDISSLLTGNLSNPIKLQLSANEAIKTNSDGYYSFYSLSPERAKSG
jgi:hypothetical protein